MKLEMLLAYSQILLLEHFLCQIIYFNHFLLRTPYYFRRFISFIYAC